MTTSEEAATGKALLALVERCEAATGPDRDLDTAIVAAMGGFTVLWNPLDPDQGFDAPTYTASLDAAMSLVPEAFGFNVWTHRTAKRAGASVTADRDGRGATVYTAATPTLALCAASLRARAVLDAPDRTE